MVDTVLNYLLIGWHNIILSSDQVKVDLSTESLPDTVTRDPEYESGAGYGVIIPSLVVAGTITRRAVEKTWLTGKF